MASAKSITVSSSSILIANNDDLLIQILLCLPLKSLQRFKSVSKHWLSLISNPNFLRHLNISDSPSALFLQVYRDPELYFLNLDVNIQFDPPFRTLNFSNDPLPIQILQSCNGLLLGCTNRSMCDPNQLYEFEDNYYVYNPTTSQHTKLPSLSDLGANNMGPYLAFDPSNSPYYKVIYLRQCNDDDTDMEIEIFSSNNGIWKKSDAIFTSEDMDNGIHGGVFWNGAIHWYTDYGPDLYFDVDSEQMKEMPMPPKIDEWERRRVIYFGESRGHFYLVECRDRSCSQFNVCEMEKDYSGWSVKYSVDFLGGLTTAFPDMIFFFPEFPLNHYYTFQILYIFRGESDEDSFMILHLPGDIIQYNFNDRSFKKLADSSNPCETKQHFTLYFGFEYIRSTARV